MLWADAGLDCLSLRASQQHAMPEKRGKLLTTPSDPSASPGHDHSAVQLQPVVSQYSAHSASLSVFTSWMPTVASVPASRTC